MGYYQGDYTGYLRGDPGFFSILGGLGRAALGLVPGGGVATRAIERVSTAATAGRGIIKQVGGTLSKHPVLTAAGAAGALGTAVGMGGGALLAPGMGAAGMRGYHMSKPHRRYGVYPKPPHLVRNRRMRVTNTKALRRAIRRAHGFARIARKVMAFTSPRRPKGHAYFRRGKRRK